MENKITKRFVVHHRGNEYDYKNDRDAHPSIGGGGVHGVIKYFARYKSAEVMHISDKKFYGPTGVTDAFNTLDELRHYCAENDIVIGATIKRTINSISDTGESICTEFESPISEIRYIKSVCYGDCGESYSGTIELFQDQYNDLWIDPAGACDDLEQAAIEFRNKHPIKAHIIYDENAVDQEIIETMFINFNEKLNEFNASAAKKYWDELKENW